MKRIIPILVLVSLMIGIVFIAPITTADAGVVPDSSQTGATYDLPATGSSLKSLSELQAKFPAGKYWNHAGSSTNSPDSYTSTPCTHHGHCSANGYTGWCGCNSFGSSIQCFGFANKLAYDAYGSLYTSWATTSLNNLKAGDVIRYKNNGHSIFVTGVNGNTITYGDCNSDGHCIIRWDVTISKSTVQSTLTAVYSAPGELTIDNNVNWIVDGQYPTPVSAYPATTSGKVTVYNRSLSAYSQDTRYIAWNDLCTINAVYTNGYCSVTYPSGSGTHTEYARKSDFIPNGVSPYGWRPSNNMNTYKRSDMSEVFGSISSADACTVVGKNGNKLQLIYPLDAGGYKLGWVDATVIPPSDFPTPMIGYTASSGNIYAHASLDSMGDTYGQIFPDDRCTLNSVSVSGGWIHVTYPITGGNKSGYVYLNDFVPDSSRLTHFYETTVTQQSDAFRKSDMAVSIGWVSVNDPITVVGKSGNKLQVLYPVDAQYGGGYKIAWIYDTYVPKNLTSISVKSNPTKLTYLEGESLNTGGLKIMASYDDGSTSDVTDSCSFSGYNSSPGVKTVTVSYGGKQTAFTVTVKSKSPVSLSIESLPSKTVYAIGESIDTTGLKAKVVYDNNTSGIVTDLDITFDDDITESSGNKHITISYVYNNIAVSTDFTITVEAGQAVPTEPINPTEPANPTEPTNPTEPVDPSSPRFVVSHVKARADSTVTVDISIENNPSITSFNYQISYPDALTLTGVEYKELFSSKATGSKKIQSPFTMSWFSTGSLDEDNNGIIATMTFKVAANVADGNYPITLTYDEDDVFNSSFENKYFDVINGGVEVISSIPGDINGDTNVNMKDIVLLQQYLNGWKVTIDADAANVNGDSSINMKDIVLLQQYLNGWDVVLK